MSDRRPVTPATATGYAYRARVVTPPDDGTLTVESVDLPGHTDTVREWPDRSPAPAHGDECLVICDLTSEPWIVQWSRT